MLSKMNPFDEELAQKLAEYTYFGLSIADAVVLLDLSHEQKREIALHPDYLRVIMAARAQAKLDLLRAAFELAKDNNNPSISSSMQKHLLASRFQVTHNKAELKQREREFERAMKFKEKSLKQWADVNTTRMVQQAGLSTLNDWKDLPQDTAEHN